MEPEQAFEGLRQVMAAHPPVRLLVVYGSRARGDDHARSDWDLGYVATEDVDPLGLLADVTSTLGTDDVDLVDLTRASGLLRFRAARDGVLVEEREPGLWEEFALTAAVHWYDVEPIVRRAHDALLEGLRA